MKYEKVCWKLRDLKLWDMKLLDLIGHLKDFFVFNIGIKVYNLFILNTIKISLGLCINWKHSKITMKKINLSINERYF